MTTVGVLALQGDVREHLVMLTACGVRAVPVRRPAELDGVDALVLPGGESTTMSRLLETFELLEPLRTRVAGGMPVYGSCAGMILLARKVLDGRPDQHQIGGLDVVVRRNAFGRQVDSFESELPLEGVWGGSLRAVFIRAPWVESAGPDVEVLARVPRWPDTGAAAGRIVAVRQGMVLATAFHPELTGDRRVHRMFCDMAQGDHRYGDGGRVSIDRVSAREERSESGIDHWYGDGGRVSIDRVSAREERSEPGIDSRGGPRARRRAAG